MLLTALALALAGLGALPAQLAGHPAPEPQADTGQASEEEQSRAAEPPKLPWRGTVLLWSQSATTETVGLGQQVQSSNPTYELTYSLRPRYYAYEDDLQLVSVHAEVGAGRELTNSDTTTRRGEWSLTDSMLFGVYQRLLHEAGQEGKAPMLPDKLILSTWREYMTFLALKLPVLTFPTSTVSRNNGTLLGLGALVAAVQDVPVLGVASFALPAFEVQLAAGYTHTFTEATQATHDELGRVRMNPEGVSFVSDQLGGAAFAAHQFTVTLQGILFITRRISWTTTFGWRPTYKYSYREEQQVCGVVATGCTTVDTVVDPQSYSVITQFVTEIGVRALDQLGVSVGYSNVTLQLAPDGTRRNLFHSPDSRLQLSVTFHLDELYERAGGRARSSRLH